MSASLKNLFGFAAPLPYDAMQCRQAWLLSIDIHCTCDIVHARRHGCACNCAAGAQLQMSLKVCSLIYIVPCANTCAITKNTNKNIMQHCMACAVVYSKASIGVNPANTVHAPLSDQFRQFYQYLSDQIRIMIRKAWPHAS